MNVAILFALSWLIHGWSGYQPLPDVADVTLDARQAKRISNVRGAHGGCIYTSPREASHAGDIVHVTLEAKGSGTAFVTIARYTDKTVFNQTSRREKFELSGEWKRYEFDFAVGDGTAGKTVKIDLQLGVGKGGEAYFANVEYDIERLVREDFDTPGVHVGGAETVQGNIAPGLLAVTGLGVITADAPREIKLPENSFSLPSRGANAFFESSVRIYSFGNCSFCHQFRNVINI